MNGWSLQKGIGAYRVVEEACDVYTALAVTVYT